MVTWKKMFFSFVLVNLGCVLLQTRSDISIMRPKQITIFGSKMWLNSLQFKGNKIFFICTNENKSAILEEVITPNYAVKDAGTYRIKNLPIIQYQIRAYEKNIFNVSENFLLFSQTHILYSNISVLPYLTSYRLNDSCPGYSVVDTMFTQTNQTMLVIAKKDRDYLLVFLEYNKSTVPQYRNVSINKLNINKYSRFCSIKYLGSRIIILFTDMIQVYSSYPLMKLVKQINIADANTESPSMALSNNLLVYCIIRTCALHNMTDDFNEMQRITFDSLVVDVAMQYPYLFIVHEATLIQYDVEVQAIISNFLNQNQSNKAQFIFDGMLVLYQKYPGKPGSIFLYGTSHTYSCDQSTLCTSCVRGYSFNDTSSTCVRQQQIPQKIKLSTSIQYSLLALSLTSSRLTPPFILLCAFYLDDLSYYNYHHTEYPQFLQSAFDNIDLANAIRINPFTLGLLPFFQDINQDTVERGMNFKYWQLLRPYHEKNPTAVYFFNSAQETYKANFLFNALLFLFLRILLFVLHVLHQNCKALRKVYFNFKTSLVWWSLLVMVAESNVMQLTFNCFTQLRLPGHFSFANKLNLIACIAVVFALVFYCFAVYPLCFGYCKKKHAEIFLVRTKRRLGSFFLEPICGVSRNLVRAAVQAVMLSSYSSQMLSLTVVNSVFLLLPLFFRKCFVSNWVFVGTVAVGAVYFAVDLVLCLHSRKLIVFTDGGFETFLYDTMIAMGSSILFVSAVMFLKNIKQFWRFLCSLCSLGSSSKVSRRVTKREPKLAKKVTFIVAQKVTLIEQAQNNQDNQTFTPMIKQKTKPKQTGRIKKGRKINIDPTSKKKGEERNVIIKK